MLMFGRVFLCHSFIISQITDVGGISLPVSDINTCQYILLFFPIVDVSYCNDDFILYLGDYITSQYVKATNN